MFILFFLVVVPLVLQCFVLKWFQTTVFPHILACLWNYFPWTVLLGDSSTKTESSWPASRRIKNVSYDLNLCSWQIMHGTGPCLIHCVVFIPSLKGRYMLSRTLQTRISYYWSLQGCGGYFHLKPCGDWVKQGRTQAHVEDNISIAVKPWHGLYCPI